MFLVFASRQKDAAPMDDAARAVWQEKTEKDWQTYKPQIEVLIANEPGISIYGETPYGVSFKVRDAHAHQVLKDVLPPGWQSVVSRPVKLCAGLVLGVPSYN